MIAIYIIMLIVIDAALLCLIFVLDAQREYDCRALGEKVEQLEKQLKTRL